MARGHGRILSSIWEDGDFLALEVGPQRLYCFLLSQKNLNHAGLIPIALRRWAKKARGLTAAAIERDLDALEAARFIVLDEDGEELLIRTFVRNDGVYKQPHVMGSMVSSALEMTSPRLRAALLAEMDHLPLDELSDEPTKPGGQSNRAKVDEHLATLRRAFAALGTLPARPTDTPSTAPSATPWGAPSAGSWDTPSSAPSNTPTGTPSGAPSSAPSADPQGDLPEAPTAPLPVVPAEPLQQPPAEGASGGASQEAPEPLVEGVAEGAPEGVPVPPAEGAPEGVPQPPAEGAPEGPYTRAHTRAHTGVPAPAHARSGAGVSPSPLTPPTPNPQPPAPPVFDATSLGAVDKSGRAGGEASSFDDQARLLLAALKPTRLRPGRRAADTVAPEVAVLLADGWPAEELAAHMTTDPPEDIRNLAGYLTQRLPAPGPYRPPSGRNPAGGTVRCPVHKLDLDAAGICRSCAADGKAAPGIDDELDQRPPVVEPRTARQPSRFGAAILDATGPLEVQTTDMAATRDRMTAEYAIAYETLIAVKPEERDELMAAALDHLHDSGYDDPSIPMITMVAAEIYNRPDYHSDHTDTSPEGTQ